MEAREGEVEVAAVIASVEAQALRSIRPLVMLSAVPGALGFTVLELARGQGSVWLGFLCAAAVALVASLRGKGEIRSTPLFTGSATVFSLASFLHFGPLLGVGLLFAGTAMLTIFLHGRRGGVASLVILSGAVLVAGVAQSQGLLAMQNSPAGAGDWARLWFTTAAVLSGLMFVHSRMQESMHGALSAEHRAESERDAARSERAQALETARAAQQLEAVGRVASGVAHDFNNSLLVLQGTLEFLEEPMSPGERSELVAEGVAAVTAAAETTRQLLGFVRRERAELNSCSPGPVIERFVRSMARVLPESVSLAAAVNLCPDLPIPASTLDQIILNLVLNARDAIDGQGTIVVGCSRSAQGEGQLIVRDTGQGMDAATAEKIFEPFFSTKGEGGTGLGLATIHELVIQSGGAVQVQTAPGLGTTFSFSWAEVAKIRRVEDDASLVATARLDLDLLLVEDQPEVARVMARSLRAVGCRVTSVDTVAGARRALSESAHFDLLCSDGLLPDGTAVDVLALYRVCHPHGAALICSGYAEQPELRALVQREGLPLLIKPFSPQELLAMVDASTRSRARAS